MTKDSPWEKIGKSSHGGHYEIRHKQTREIKGFHPPEVEDGLPLEDWLKASADADKVARKERDHFIKHNS